MGLKQPLSGAIKRSYPLLLAALCLLWFGCREEPANVEPTPEGNQSEGPAPETTPVTKESDEESTLQYAAYPEFEGRRLGILHSGNVMGELDDCGCNIRPLGGLARKIQWVESHREGWDDIVLVDAGDLFSNKANISEKERTIALSRAQTFVEAYNAASYDAVAIGDRDLALGVEALQAISEKASFPLLSANLIDVKTRKTVFTERVLLQKGELKIGVFGLLPARLPSGLPAMDSFRVVDPVVTAKSQTEALYQQGANIVIAIGHLSDPTLEKLANRVEGLTVILGGQSVAEPRHPTRINTSYLVGGHEKGKNLSALTLFVVGDDFSFSDPRSRSRLKEQITKLEERVASRTSSLKKASESKAATNVDWLKKDLVKARTELQMARMDLSELEEGEEDGSFIGYDLIAMEKALPDHAPTLTQVDALKEEYPSLKKKNDPKEPSSKDTPSR